LLGGPLVFVHYILQEGSRASCTIRFRNITAVDIISVTNNDTYPGGGMMCCERLANGTHPYDPEDA
jgi:hypothetical protein